MSIKYMVIPDCVSNKRNINGVKLSSSDKRTFELIYTFFHQGYHCFMSKRKMARRLGISKSTVAKSVRRLKKAKLINVSRKFYRHTHGIHKDILTICVQELRHLVLNNGRGVQKSAVNITHNSDTLRRHNMSNTTPNTVLNKIKSHQNKNTKDNMIMNILNGNDSDNANMPSKDNSKKAIREVTGDKDHKLMRIFKKSFMNLSPSDIKFFWNKMKSWKHDYGYPVVHTMLWRLYHRVISRKESCDFEYYGAQPLAKYLEKGLDSIRTNNTVLAQSKADYDQDHKDPYANMSAEKENKILRERERKREAYINNHKLNRKADLLLQSRKHYKH